MWGWRSSIPLDRIYMIRYVSLLYAYGSEKSTMPNPAETLENKALVQASFDRWSAGTGSPFELLAPDADWTIVGSSPLSKTYPQPTSVSGRGDSTVQRAHGDAA